MFGIAKRNAIEELQHKSYKYLYNLCRLYYANTDKQIRYCITNLYSVVGHIPCVNYRYPRFENIYNELTCKGYNNLMLLIDDYVDVLKYNNQGIFDTSTKRSISLENFIVGITTYVSDHLCDTGRIDFNEFADFIMKELDIANGK